jgi:hypothetical protein
MKVLNFPLDTLQTLPPITAFTKPAINLTHTLKISLEKNKNSAFSRV